MHYSTIFVALLAAAASAAPQGQRQQRPAADNTLRVILSDLGETGAQNQFNEPHPRAAQAPSQSGPFKTVELKLGAGVKNQELRCQILDANHKPIVVTRGANTDITFADGGKGAWTFRAASKVSSIVCDQGFKKIGADANEVRVVLSNQAIELGGQTTFTAGSRQEKAPVGGRGPWQTAELRLGELVDPAYRCQLVDGKGMPVTLVRGQNVAKTFGDGDKGEWKVQKGQSDVSKIVCDPTFKA